MNWIVFAMGAAVAMAAADFLIKLASGKLSNSLAVMLYGAGAFVVGLVWVIWQRLSGIELSAQPAGVAAAVAVGLSFSMVTLGLYASFGAGAPISSASPVVRLGGLVLASLAGLILLKEPLSFRYVAGMLLAGSGIYLIVSR